MRGQTVGSGPAYSIEKGTTITVVYYCTHGQCYNQLTGPVSKIDSFWHSLQLGQVCIDFEDIYVQISLKRCKDFASSGASVSV